MATLQTQLPASFKPALPQIPSRRANPGNLTESARPYLIAGRRGRTASVGRTAFEPLPRESEDAKITGATRSLERRLLALNLYGSRIAVKSVTEIIQVRTEARMA